MKIVQQVDWRRPNFKRPGKCWEISWKPQVLFFPEKQEWENFTLDELKEIIKEMEKCNTTIMI